MPKYHGYKMLVGVSSNLLPTSLLITHILALPGNDLTFINNKLDPRKVTQFNIWQDLLEYAKIAWERDLPNEDNLTRPSFTTTSSSIGLGEMITSVGFVLSFFLYQFGVKKQVFLEEKSIGYGQLFVVGGEI